MNVEKIIFDQYSRYRACSDLLAQAGIGAGNTILDIGSGPEMLFRHFVPGAKMSFVDPLIPEGATHSSISGNVFDARLDDAAFDCVSAVDVLEHVPPDVRGRFVERVSSLAKDILILGFPVSDTTVAASVDKAVEEQYRTVYGTDYSWLEEHYRFGLPSLSATVSQLEDMGWHCQTVGHGYAPWLEELLGFTVNVWEIPDLADLVLDISEKFNRELYCFDFRDPCYRHFIIATRIEIPRIAPPCSDDDARKADEAFRRLMAEAREQYLARSLPILKNITEIRDEVIREKDKALVELESIQHEIDGLKSSMSWRITSPLRTLTKKYLHVLLEYDRRRIRNTVRRRYHKLPLPGAVKRIISFIYHRVLGAGIRQIRRLAVRYSRFRMPSSKPAYQKEGVPDYIIWGVIPWHFRHQRPQHIGLQLAASGRRVFYISALFVDDGRGGFEIEKLDSEGRLFEIKMFVRHRPSIYQSAPSIEIFNQLVAGVGEVMEWANCIRLVSIVQHPFWYRVASVLPDSQLVYDCMDHHEGFGNNGESLMSLEKEMLTTADIVITTSAWLEDSIKNSAKNFTLIRNAGEYDYFSVRPPGVYQDPHGRRIIGYYGAIAEWFDLQLVESVAKRFEDCVIMLVGEDSANVASGLSDRPNITFTGEVPYSQLTYYLYSFDVCILPFRVMPLTLATNPVKLYEYLSAGKPVVTVDLPEMKQFGDLVYVAPDTQRFLKDIDNALGEDSVNNDLVERRKEFASGQTWAHRASQIIKVAESVSEPKVSVVVLTYNNLELTRLCLSSIEKYSMYSNLEIVVVDNASEDGTQDYLRNWASGFPNSTLILNDKNNGFAKGNNQGLDAASGDYLVLLNNDTHVTPGWIRTLVNHLRRDPTIGLIGPVTNNIGNEAKIDIEYDNMDDMVTASASFIRRHIGNLYPLRTAAFFCVMMKREVFERVGGLDEGFGRGFFEDDDYCRRIEQIGLRIVCAEDVFVHHHLSASFDKLEDGQKEELFKRNKEIYESKWGKWIPHDYR